MTDDQTQAHFAAINPLINALFEISEIKVEDDGFFTPHGAALFPPEEVRLIQLKAGGEASAMDPRAGLPDVKEGLAAQSEEAGCIGIGVAMLVTLEDGMRNAIKVQVEHNSGFAMTFYLPFSLKGPGDVEFDDLIRQAAEPSLGNWPQG